MDVDPTERDPLTPHTEDNDDDGEDRKTNPFPPGSSSTPYGEQMEMRTTTNLPRERGPHTSETSFIEGTPLGRVLSPNSLKIRLAHMAIEQEYPEYGKNGKLLTLIVKIVDKKRVVFVVGPKGGNTPLFKADGRTINPKISKTDMKILGPHRTEMIQQMDEEIKELDKTTQEYTEVANDENEQPSVREGARKEIREYTERKTQIENKREQLVKGLRHRVKDIFKKYGWTIQAVVLAAGLVIGAVALAAMNTMKGGLKAVGNGLKEIGKKVGSILPGLIGSIVSFIFKAAGQVISFLGEHAWLLILVVVGFLIERLTKRKRS